MNSDMVAYCGLCCQDCFGYKGIVADLARDLRKELRASKFKRFADFSSNQSFGKVYKDYDKCYEVLGAMVKFSCHKGCRSGGGNPFCKIRNCCQKSSFEGCWQCPDYETCEKLHFLIPVHQDAHLKNLRKIKKQGIEVFLESPHNW
ncbi:MAG: DUF3795 domain-containing protein [Chloroflexi bacterium]|nr:DUF3795 domain-containing protein [Chloroflexota bacterium]